MSLFLRWTTKVSYLALWQTQPKLPEKTQHILLVLHTLPAAAVAPCTPGDYCQLTCVTEVCSSTGIKVCSKEQFCRSSKVSAWCLPFMWRHLYIMRCIINIISAGCFSYISNDLFQVSHLLQQCNVFAYFPKARNVNGYWFAAFCNSSSITAANSDTNSHLVVEEEGNSNHLFLLQRASPHNYQGIAVRRNRREIAEIDEGILSNFTTLIGEFWQKMQVLSWAGLFCRLLLWCGK